MTQRQYDAATAKALMRLAYQEYEGTSSAPYVESDDGLHVNESFREVCPPGAVFDWTPADEMDWRGSPNPDTAPFLPVPFTASELAACMLDGPGRSIQDALDRRIGYPLDDGALGFIRARRRWMCEALEEAYALGAAAQLVVGEFDHDEEARAHQLLDIYSDAYGQALEREKVMEREVVGTKKDGSPEYGNFIPRGEYLRRLRRAKTSVAGMKAQARQAQSVVTLKWTMWRKAMVRQLLVPAQITNSVPVIAQSFNNAQHKRRRGLLDPVIEAAQRTCIDPFDAPVVWAALVRMAKDGKQPLLGVTDEGIKWQDANDEPKFLTLKNLRERLRRRDKQRCRT